MLRGGWPGRNKIKYAGGKGMNGCVHEVSALMVQEANMVVYIRGLECKPGEGVRTDEHWQCTATTDHISMETATNTRT